MSCRLADSLVAIVLLYLGDEPFDHAVVPDAPRVQDGSAFQGARVNRELAGPAHPKHDNIVLLDLIAHLVALPGEHLLTDLDARDESVQVALAARRIHEVGALEKAHVLGYESSQLALGRPASIEGGDEGEDQVEVVAHRGCAFRVRRSRARPCLRGGRERRYSAIVRPSGIVTSRYMKDWLSVAHVVTGSPPRGRESGLCARLRTGAAMRALLPGS